MSIRESFVTRFSEEQAKCIEDAAFMHTNGVHDERGSDSFKWAICICLGSQCMDVDSYRKYHDITVPWDELKKWIKEEADLVSHDGDVDFLAAFCGVYNEYMPDTWHEKDGEEWKK